MLISLVDVLKKMPVLVCIVFILLNFNDFSHIRCEVKNFDFESQSDDRFRSVPYYNRVVSMAPSVTEIIFSIQAHNKLVGVSSFSNYPEEAKLLPKVGSYIKPDLERIIALKPDICIAVKDGTPIHVVDRLEKFGIPVYLISSENLDAVITSIIKIGCLLDVGARSDILAKFLENRINSIKDIVNRSDRIPRIFFQLGIYPIISVGKGTVINDLIEMTGGVNVTEGLGLYPRLSFEEALNFFPDVVIITSMLGNVSLNREKLKWEKWLALLPRAKACVFIENSDLFNRPSPRLVQGLEMLSRKIHPELFEEFL